jgi:hypothetical protein
LLFLIGGALLLLPILFLLLLLLGLLLFVAVFLLLLNLLVLILLPLLLLPVLFLRWCLLRLLRSGLGLLLFLLRRLGVFFGLGLFFVLRVLLRISGSGSKHHE